VRNEGGEKLDVRRLDIKFIADEPRVAASARFRRLTNQYGERAEARSASCRSHSPCLPK